MLLAACASTPPSPHEAGWTAGRLSLRIDAAGEAPAQSVSAAFELRGDGESGELRLNSPLGSRVASARWAPGLALLDDGKGERSFDSLAALSQQALGEALPLQALPNWLAGRPWSGAAHAAAAEGFEQLGWQVDLARRAEGWIEARRSTPPVVRLRVKLDDAP
ncbi:MAG: outer membrane lipoprotein LolB [Leptothrix sp. (in: Bacteria)]|nr:outer membrane lipoprotein LolB [Leptothrix sp. (in: b-proteobacteria)]